MPAASVSWVSAIAFDTSRPVRTSARAQVAVKSRGTQKAPARLTPQALSVFGDRLEDALRAGVIDMTDDTSAVDSVVLTGGELLLLVRIIGGEAASAFEAEARARLLGRARSLGTK